MHITKRACARCEWEACGTGGGCALLHLFFCEHRYRFRRECVILPLAGMLGGVLRFTWALLRFSRPGGMNKTFTLMCLVDAFIKGAFHQYVCYLGFEIMFS